LLALLAALSAPLSAALRALRAAAGRWVDERVVGVGGAEGLGVGVGEERGLGGLATGFFS